MKFFNDALIKNARSAILLALIPILFASATQAQTELPSQYGEYRVGYSKFDAAPGRDVLETAVWYPATAESEGDRFAYSWRGIQYESPFRGVLSNAAPVPGESFPLVVLSHGAYAWPENFANLGESLASHGYVVAAPQHDDSNSTVGRHEEFKMALDAMLERATTPGDLLNGIVSTDKLVVGGYSLGLATVSESIRLHDYMPEAVLYIDGGGIPHNKDIPTLHVAGGNVSATRTTLGAKYIGVDLFSADATSNIHHWSFGLQACQIREKLLETGATQDEVDDATAGDWFGCAEELVLPEIVQLRTNQYSVGFLNGIFGESQFGIPSSIQRGLSVGPATLIVETNAQEIGPRALLTDARERSFGVDEDGRFVDDFGRANRIGRPESMEPTFEFGIKADSLVDGDYRLQLHGDHLSAPTDYRISLRSELAVGDDIVFLAEQLASGQLAPGVDVDPVTFSLVLPPDGDCSFDQSVGPEDLLCVAEIDDRDLILSAIQSVPGDLDGNGDVSFVDFLVLSSNFGSKSRAYRDGNVNLVGRIDMDDFLILASNFGTTQPLVAIVPEPSCGTLVVIFSAITSFNWRRQNKNPKVEGKWEKPGFC